MAYLLRRGFGATGIGPGTLNCPGDPGCPGYVPSDVLAVVNDPTGANTTNAQFFNALAWFRDQSPEWGKPVVPSSSLTDWLNQNALYVGLGAAGLFLFMAAVKR